MCAIQVSYSLDIFEDFHQTLSQDNQNVSAKQELVIAYQSFQEQSENLENRGI